LDWLGLPLPSSLDGVSLRPLLLDPEADLELEAYIESQYAALQFGWAPLSGLRSKGYKFVDAPRQELYDLTADPGETRNLADERPDLVERFQSNLEALRTERPRETQRNFPDPETVERLRALGYVTSSLSSPSVRDAALADPKDKIGLFNRLDEAREARNKHDADGALEILAGVIEEDPEVTLAHLMVGNIRLGKGEFQEAEQAFRSVIELDDGNTEGLFGLALAHKGLGSYREAAQELERLLELDPNQVRAIHELAEVHLAMGQGERAERLLSELDPEDQDVTVKLTLANSLLAQERRQEAIAILNAIEQSRPEEEQALLFLGNLYFEIDDEERAVAVYQRAVRVAASPGARSDRREAEVFNVVGHRLARHGDLPSAALAFQKAIQRDTSLAAGHSNLGIVFARMKQFGDAEKAFLQAIENDPAFAEAYYNLGNLYIETENIDQAIQMFRRALAIRPEYARARAKLEQLLAGRPE
jgi:tetratricopeptide (TPR) repeat protein